MPLYCTFLTHMINPFKCSSNIHLFSGVKAIVKKPQPFGPAQQCEVPFSHKGGLFVMALLSVPLPDSKLCALLLLSLMEQSHAPPHRLLAEPSWELNSHWLGGIPGRIGELLLCLHASRENPNNNCYLGQPDNLQLSRQTGTWGCELIVHAHTRLMREPGVQKQALFSLTL